MKGFGTVKKVKEKIMEGNRREFYVRMSLTIVTWFIVLVIVWAITSLIVHSVTTVEQTKKESLYTVTGKIESMNRLVEKSSTLMGTGYQTIYQVRVQGKLFNVSDFSLKDLEVGQMVTIEGDNDGVSSIQVEWEPPHRRTGIE